MFFCHYTKLSKMESLVSIGEAAGRHRAGWPPNTRRAAIAATTSPSSSSNCSAIGPQSSYDFYEVSDAVFLGLFFFFCCAMMAYPLLLRGSAQKTRKTETATRLGIAATKRCRHRPGASLRESPAVLLLV
jgi:hypothetical protein